MKNRNTIVVNNLGRKTGSKNKLTLEAKKKLYEVLEDEFKDIGKLMCTLPLNERLTELKFYSKFLASGNDTIAKEVRETIYEQLKPHYKRMNTFISHVPQEKRLSELRAFLKMLGPQAIEEVIIDMRDIQKVRFTKR